MMKKCKRNNCQCFNRNMNNNCVGLTTVYEDSYKCPFYKKKENDKEEIKSGK